MKKRLNKYWIAAAFLVLVIGLIGEKMVSAPERKGTGTRYCLLGEAAKNGKVCAVGLMAATTLEEQAKGLGGRDSLGNNEGMVFIFDNAGRQCFWMKNMRFNIDIVWLDKDKKVIKMQPDIAPDTYPEEFCAENTMYVLELAPHRAVQLNLETGKTADISDL